jgi:uncharacterized membrane protein
MARKDGSGLARALGWFSVGLGAVQLLAPERLDRLIGVESTDGSRRLMRAVGLQELTVGLGILRRERPAGLLWTRVGGDLSHLALLANAYTSEPRDRTRVRNAAAAVVATTALDVAAGVLTTGNGASSGGPLQTRTVTTINRPIDEVYRRWRALEDLPRSMTHLRSVTVTGSRTSHWVADAPTGTVEWDAVITDDRPGELIAWRSADGADVDHRGTVRFREAPRDQGTEVEVELVYEVPGGKLGRAVAQLLGEHPEQQAKDDLRRFKQLLETGEVSRSAGSPDGSRAARQWNQEAAR